MWQQPSEQLSLSCVLEQQTKMGFYSISRHWHVPRFNKFLGPISPGQISLQLKKKSTDFVSIKRISKDSTGDKESKEWSEKRKH